jgi:hypothetical protein
MSLLNRTLRAAEALKSEDTAAVRNAARLTPRAQEAAAPAEAESDLAHALRTRRMLRTPLSETR